MNTKRIFFSLTPLLLFTTCGEVTARIVGAPTCSAIIPDAGDWDTMQGDAELLWALEPNRRFQTGNDVTEINAVGLREKLLPNEIQHWWSGSPYRQASATKPLGATKELMIGLWNALNCKIS